MKVICEYIWLDAKGEIRSKTRCLSISDEFSLFQEWNYDASSTGQADCNGNTEGILIPCRICKNPLLYNKYKNYIILCEARNINNEPLEGNYRKEAFAIFETNKEEIPWFGLEQEYFFTYLNAKDEIFSTRYDDDHYCKASSSGSKEVLIVREHLEACLDAGLQISGLNAEVVIRQWEFQIGPCEGINAADQLIIARYLLEQIASKYMMSINYEPKPIENKNGSGCHTNFSTQKMREPGGIDVIYSAIEKLKEKHQTHMEAYGDNNRMRLTGKYETADYDTFSYGLGTRNTSIRIPNIVVKDGFGYFEDRRPAANMDPYRVTSLIFKTCCS